MPNDEVYASGLLNRALDPATQPREIQAFLQAELDLLYDVIVEGMRVVDVGCGTGRHLLLLTDRVRLGLGVDYEHSYVAEAHRRRRAGGDLRVSRDGWGLSLRALLGGSSPEYRRGVYH